ncbi:LAMI_0F14664g1_1 [Lachancea mirantina]|uniref:LAMI_0F14664g1_1 n=1 Tax=Lachancea mirantina TaxID=1230905 RepID=A0A1G4K402_9SACH|nr:LAMI_0F14664g1_1 [Lachancea mirantina]
MSGKKLRSKNQIFRRQKVHDARSIRAEAIEAADQASGELSETGGVLKVNEFLASREFEVRQLQSAMHKSKNAASTRVFQRLPRKLRRRTASHNVRRIPKRMRNRALREMKKSDQSLVLGKLTKTSGKTKHALSAKQLYKARMAVKLLRLAAKSKSMKLALPSEATASHYKLRSRIRALQKLVKAHTNKQSLPQRNNAMGSYDSTAVNALATAPVSRIKYAKRQRQFVWLPTHVWSAKRCHMYKRWGYHMPWSPTQKCFRLTHKLGNNVAASDGAMCCDTSFVGTMVISSEDAAQLKELMSKLTKGRACLKKYYRSQYWFEGLCLDDANSYLGPVSILWITTGKVLLRAHPAIYESVFTTALRLKSENVMVEDCRFSIGSITLTGSKSLNALSQIIRASKDSASFKQFKQVSSLTDITALPQRTSFAFQAIDPRHLSRPKKLGTTQKLDENFLFAMQASYPEEEVANVMSALCSSTRREASYKNQQTLKQLSSRRRKLLASSNSNLIPFDAATDPQIPIAIFKQRFSENWVLLLPWFWLLPFWYQLNRVSRVHPMGSRQLQQLSFEQGTLHFPDDYIFTRAGFDENMLYKRLSQKALWDRKPPSKRINYFSIPNLHKSQPVSMLGEIGDPFCSDWRFLQILRNGVRYLRKEKRSEFTMLDPERTTQFDDLNIRKLEYVNDVVELYFDVKDKSPQALPLNVIDCVVTRYEPKEMILDSSPQYKVVTQPVSVVCCRLELLERGHPKDNARIYSIPEEDLAFWHDIGTGTFRSNGKRDHNAPRPLPHVSNLIGFVTSGTYHLGKGKGVCTGFIDADEAVANVQSLVLVRNVGTDVYRLARWNQILV